MKPLPTIADSRLELLGMELVCSVPRCRHSKLFSLEAFKPNDTVRTIAARAQCTQCGAKIANVFPLWRPPTMGLP